MNKMLLLKLFQILATSFYIINAEAPKPPNTETSQKFYLWGQVGRITGLLLKDCFKTTPQKSFQDHFLDAQKCFKYKSYFIIDRLLKRDVIGIVNGVKLVRYQRRNLTNSIRSEISRSDSSYNIQLNWVSEIYKKIWELLDTHDFKINLTSYNSNVDEGRRRRQQNMMFSLMMFGIVAVKLIMIPLGFLFLAVLGGKALLLAKMALLLTTIQGLKKIATSNVNYGLYSTTGSSSPWSYDRQWMYDGDNHDYGTKNYDYLQNEYTNLNYPQHYIRSDDPNYAHPRHDFT